MQPFQLEALLVPSLIILFLTIGISFRVSRSVTVALPAAFVKAGLFLLYFGVLFDGAFTFQDDWEYLKGGRILYAHDVGITNLARFWDFSQSVGHGDHFVYYLYNAYAFRLFGEGYYAPVALNIMLTVFVAWFGVQLAEREFGLAGMRRKVFFFFLLLHPDILAWSNVMNGKDVLVLLLHVLMLISISLFFRQRYRYALALATPVSLVLLFTRSYVPLLFSISLLIGVLTSKKINWRVRFGFVGIVSVSFVLLVFHLGGWTLEKAFIDVRADFVNPIYGFVRFALTPIPFNTERAYSFLNFPACLHWFLFPFALRGIVVIHRLRTPFSRFFLLYLLVFSGLYAVYGELQGPRHRVQMDYAWAVLQFMGLIAFVQAGFAQRGQQQSRPHSAPNARA